MQCEHCSAPLTLPGARPRSCPRCKAMFYAVGLSRKTVELEAIAPSRRATVTFSVERLESMTAKPLEPADLLPVELFRCPLCGHGIVLGTVAEPARDGTAFYLRLPVKRALEVRCAYCGRPNAALLPAEEPLTVPVVPLKRDSFDYQVEQFLQQPPLPPPRERSGCLGLLLLLFAPR